MSPKMATKSSKYELRLKCDKGQAYAIGLYSYRRNTEVKEVLVHDTALLFQYSITVPQMNYLDTIQKIAETSPYKVPCSFEKISKFKPSKPKRKRA